MLQISLYFDTQTNGVETIFTPKLLVNFTINYKETVSKTLNYTNFKKNEKLKYILLYAYSNYFCFIYNLKKKLFFTVYAVYRMLTRLL